MNLTEQVVNYIQKTEYGNLSAADIEKAKLCLIDWIAVALAGSREPISEITFQLIDLLGGSGQATILGKGVKTNLLLAALINGTNSHALDYDDVHIETSGHPSVTIIPAILSLAEWKKLSGTDFITAFVTGVQVFFSIGAAIMPCHYEEGWHNTGTFGRFAAATASAKLLGFNESMVLNALGTAATQAAGLQNVFGTMCKPFNAGKAAMDGLLAALLAERGFTSSIDPIGARNGFLEVYSSKSNHEAMEKALVNNNYLRGVTFKRYPSCFGTHTAIDCMLSLRARNTINLNEIAEIQCVVYPRCIGVCDIAEPQTGLEGKFSIQFCLALALEDGKISIDSFHDSNMKKTSLVDIMKKVKLVADSTYTETRTSKVIIKFKDGHSIQETVVLSELLSDWKKEKAGIILKYKDIAYSVLPQQQADRLLEAIDSLEKIDNMADIVKLCSL
jgi:2-methylcitrate dehydratase PrpD